MKLTLALLGVLNLALSIVIVSKVIPWWLTGIILALVFVWAGTLLLLAMD